MVSTQKLKELKSQIKASVRRNSDRGFLPYSACNRVCSEIYSIMQQAEDYAKKRNTNKPLIFL